MDTYDCGCERKEPLAEDNLSCFAFQLYTSKLNLPGVASAMYAVETIPIGPPVRRRNISAIVSILGSSQGSGDYDAHVTFPGLRVKVPQEHTLSA